MADDYQSNGCRTCRTLGPDHADKLNRPAAFGTNPGGLQAYGTGKDNRSFAARAVPRIDDDLTNEDLRGDDLM